MNKSHYPLDIFWSDEDAGFIAEVRDLPGCSAWGATETAAVREARDAIASWIQAAKATGRAIPAPTVGEPVDRFSGKFLVRVPKSLHARLARDASKEGVSLNQYVLTRLAS
jgi:predicted RNase H-like HicB family nuclease